MKVHEIVRNISYSFSANLVSLGVSVFMVMFVPKFLSAEDYGLWQLFLFYFSYLGFLHFGWEDGIYLRYAGKRFDELDSKVFSGQFCFIFLSQVIMAGLISLGCNFFVEDINKKFALVCAVWLAPLVNFNNLCDFIMQITNRIRDYALLLFTERVILLFSVTSFLVIGFHEYIWMYSAKIISIAGAVATSGYFCRQLFQLQFDSFSRILEETWKNISAGIKLMFANMASMLIVGVIRYGISLGWNIATFGRVSLTLGISNFLMVFINSVSVVFFPFIKKMDKEERARAYIRIRRILSILLLSALLAYYPLKSILGWWLPKYADSLIYMSVLFPVCLFESKMSLLVNTYLKSMRQETLMLRINLFSVITSVAVTFITVEVLHDLNAAVLSIVFLYAFRCILAEYFVSCLLGLSLARPILEDLGMVGIFMASGWFLDNWLCMVIYSLAYIVYIVSQRKYVKELVDVVIKK